MSVGLFDAVVSESYNMGEGDAIAIMEQEIEERITDDPATMMEYTGECQLAMLATEAAVAKMEGVNSVRYILAEQAGDEAAMEETLVAMEGFLGDVWETLKEWVIKAYTAVKNFLIKVWNKMKGYAGQIQAFFSKYQKVLANKRVPGLMVDWCTINVAAARNRYERFHRELNQLADEVSRAKFFAQTANRATAAASGHRDSLTYSHDDNAFVGAGRASQNIRDAYDADIPTPQTITRTIEDDVYPDGKTDRQVAFERIRRDAIEAADIPSYKKYIDFHLRLGDTGMQESLNCVNNAKRESTRGNAMAKATGTTKLHAYIRRILNAQVSLHRICSSIMATAAKRMQSQSIRACRKAIMFHSTEGEGATETNESYAPDMSVDGLMAEML